VWYFFRSDTLREIVYETMLSDQRRALHQQVGEWYERELLSCTAPDAERFQHEENAGVDGENGDEKVSMSWGTATDHSSVSGTVPEDKEEIDPPSGNEGSRNSFASSPTRSSSSSPRKSSPMNLARSSSGRSFSGCVAGVPDRRTHRSGQDERPSVFNASLATARRVVELYPPLAYHWSRSGVLEKAIAYLKLAAESAAFQGMYTEAEKWHRECLVFKEHALDATLANRAALAVQAKLESMQRDESTRGDTNTPAAAADDHDRDSDSDDSVDYNEEDEDDPLLRRSADQCDLAIMYTRFGVLPPASITPTGLLETALAAEERRVVRHPRGDCPALAYVLYAAAYGMLGASSSVSNRVVAIVRSLIISSGGVIRSPAAAKRSPSSSRSPLSRSPSLHVNLGATLAEVEKGELALSAEEQKARSLFERALVIRRRQRDVVGVAETLNGLGTLYQASTHPTVCEFPNLLVHRGMGENG
jgi:hypothetical protein